MKLRKILTTVRDSLLNIIRHPLITLASVTTVTLMLLLMGVFIVVSLNAGNLVKVVAQQPPVEVWCDAKLTAQQQQDISAYLTADSNVLSFTMLTPEENYEQLKASMGEAQAALDNFDYAKLPYVYQVKLQDPDLADQFVAQIKAFPGVTQVDMAESVMQKLTRIINLVNAGTLLAFAILLVISLFIIANMVRISVFSRAEEINIMKYVGATNAYIRWPYILEGTLIGTVGALISSGLVYAIYQWLYQRVVGGQSSSDLGVLAPRNFVLPLSNLAWIFILVNLALGVLIGAAGSAMSVRKYIKV
ncbi:ABC transporter permease [Oscillospiraceae bacterium HV4-5-C5C]|nr:ABC transporter permease [Oscillospiraceae bacterium HV4-5-C5C]